MGDRLDRLRDRQMNLAAIIACDLAHEEFDTSDPDVEAARQIELERQLFPKLVEWTDAILNRDDIKDSVTPHCVEAIYTYFNPLESNLEVKRIVDWLSRNRAEIPGIGHSVAGIIVFTSDEVRQYHAAQERGLDGDARVESLTRGERESWLRLRENGEI